MDPRHPELVLPRVKELLAQYEKVESKIKGATLSSQLGGFEREGSLVIQEICLTAPRLHEAMMLVSRNKRKGLSQQIVPEFSTPELVGPTAQVIAINEATTEEAEVAAVEPKPKKKKSNKKKES